jgi:hypothetical protein
MKEVKTQDYRLGILKKVYARHVRNGGNSEIVIIRTRMELLAYKYLAKRGFISFEEVRPGIFMVLVLQPGIEYIRNIQQE